MRYIALLVLLFTVWKAHAQKIEKLAGKLSLKQCVETAIANNQSVRAAGFQSELDNAGYHQSKANRFPALNGNISHGTNQGRSIDPFTNGYVNQQINFANYSLNGSITLWNGSSIQQNIRQNEWNSKASSMDYQQLKDNTTISVILAYLQVLNNQEQLGIAKKQVDVTRNQVERLAVLQKDGAIIPSVYYDLKGQLSNDELNVITVQNSLETAKINLAQLMNVDYNKEVILEAISDKLIPVIYENGPDSIYQQATQKMALVKAAEYRKNGSAAKVSYARGQLLPTLGLYGGLGTNYSSIANRLEFINSTDIATSSYVNVGTSKLPVYAPQNNYASQKISYGNQWANNFNSTVSLGLQIPILNGLQAKTRVIQAKVLDKKANFDYQTVKTQLRQSVDQAYINMNTSFEKYQTLLKQVDDYTHSFQVAETRFNAGLTTTVEYLAAKNNLDRSIASFATAKYDYFLRSKILDYYQGKQLW
ncbi:MAG: TolC family protein [Chitinophagaceae bacterium]|nr:TolC family protein [Chitinophagaceae bacterium]